MILGDPRQRSVSAFSLAHLQLAVYIQYHKRQPVQPVRTLSGMWVTESELP